ASSSASMSGPAIEKYEAGHSPARSMPPIMSGIFWSLRLKVQLTDVPETGSVMVYGATPAVLLASWQVTHLALSTLWMAESHAMPTSFSWPAAFAPTAVEIRFGFVRSVTGAWRIARGVRPNICVGPMAAASVRPGLITVDELRDSWQPPQTRDSPRPPENQTGSGSSAIPNLSMA